MLVAATRVLADHQDELISAVIRGGGAGGTCKELLEDCKPSRARLLLGPDYHDEMSDHASLGALEHEVGYTPGAKAAAKAASKEEEARAVEAHAKRMLKPRKERRKDEL